MESPPADGSRSFVARALDSLEKWGNKLPDPAVLFVIGLVVVWILSALLADVAFEEVRAEIYDELVARPVTPLETTAYTMRWRDQDGATGAGASK